MTKIAVLQMTSGIDPEENFEIIADGLARAREGGAQMLFTPEMSLLLDQDRARATPRIEDPAARAWPERLQRLVSEQGGPWLALGSYPVATEGGRWRNRSLLIDPAGERQAVYDKIHMFDVDLDSGERWRESNAYAAGDTVVTAEDTPLGRLGLAICYDMRFPALFEALGQRRCDAVAIPAAFTVPTGKAHWHVLLRARAIEASAFVIAAAQVGRHPDGRETYGHSLVVDPWGEVLLDMGGAGPGLGFCDVDLARIEAVRAQVPSLANRRQIAN
ncbi:carbon-nitrogen hydrolase family protein [Qipengyuania nanhaisediminis]|uniref:carbon-nitrogen hydrolase family protein n=1 Tax=Qipengyuania nanhaisediminis TaxID=604088 RepID=UPI0038B346D2